jgi:tetratricopeptide (TPR) repeat protein
MAVFQSEDRQRMRRLRSEKAIQLAMQNRWQEAADLNRQILEHFPEDVDTLNRLGKSLMELGQYADARAQYQKAATVDPSNGIAVKNLARLTKLAEEASEAPAAAVHSKPVDPSLFIEESGKTAVTDLVDVAPYQAIATLTAGDKLDLKVEQGTVRVIGPAGSAVGQLEPKIAQRVTRLITAGNRYSAAITSIDENHVRIIVREEFRHPSMRSRPSFPTQAADIRPSIRDSVFRVDIDDDDEDLLDETEVDAETSDTAEADMEGQAKDSEDDSDDDS